MTSSSSSVSVLFCRHDSIYKALDCDVWDMERDARLFSGSNPVVTHPPCRAWGSLRRWAKPRRGERLLARLSLEWVRRNGGVLEHPARSVLWDVESLPLGRERDAFGGYTIVVDQNWWGHRARKRTRLYICGVSAKALPAMPLSLKSPTHTVGLYSGRDKATCLPGLPKSEMEKTPILFAEWLVDIARLAGETRS